jgi:hypothetical protein
VHVLQRIAILAKRVRIGTGSQGGDGRRDAWHTLCFRIRVSILRSLLAISLVLLTAAAGWSGAHLPVDLENGTMKSVGTRDAGLAERRNLEFGSDCTVLLLLEPRAATLRTDRSDPEVATWLTGLRRHRCVLSADVVPDVRKGGGLVVAARLAPGVEAARAVAAFAAGSAPAVFRVSATGHVLGEAAIAESLADEQARIVPLIVGALFAMLLLFFRHWALALAPLLPAAAGICWVGGLQAMLGPRRRDTRAACCCGPTS